NKFEEAHNASADVNATARAFMELLRLGVISCELSGLTEEEYRTFREINTECFQPFEIEITTQVQDYRDSQDTRKVHFNESKKPTTESPFFHFHNHTSFSILTSTISVETLVQRAVEEKMPAVGITDLGNLMGAFKFVSAIKKANSSLETPVIPIIGCEFYVSENYKQ